MKKLSLMVFAAVLSNLTWEHTGFSAEVFQPVSSAGDKAPIVKRDSNGRIKRSSTARRHFREEYSCPSTGESTGACPGYVIDHIIPLKKGGADSPANMQWQTIEDARQKDLIE